MIYKIQPIDPTKKDGIGNIREPLTVKLDDGIYSNPAIMKGQAILTAYQQGEQLIGYDLSEADCRLLYLPGVIMIGCNLRNTDFTGAYIVGGNFSMSNVEDAIWRAAYGRGAKTGDFKDPTLVNTVTEYYESHPVLGMQTALDLEWRNNG